MILENSETDYDVIEILYGGKKYDGPEILLKKTASLREAIKFGKAYMKDNIVEYGMSFKLKDLSMYTTKPMNRKPVILPANLNHIKIDMPSAGWLLNKHKNTRKPFHEVLAVVFAIVILYFTILAILIAW